MTAGETQVQKSIRDEWSRDPGASQLPAAVDVAIIGGGIVGAAASFFLARAGVSVLLCEKGRIAGEQSGRNWGWVRQQGRSPVELPLMIRSLALWRTLKKDLGADLDFAQGGSTYLATDAAQLESFRPWLAIARAHQLDTRLLTSSELGTVLKSGNERWAGGMHTASDGRAEPNRAAPAIVRGAERAGAIIRTGCAVRGIECAAGRVHAIVTEHGAVRTSTVLCAGGAWTSLFCRSLDIEVPQLLVKGTVARIAPTTALLEGEAWSHDVAIRRRQDGGYTVARGSALEHALTPATFRYLRKFWPAMRQEQGAVRLRLGRDFLHAAMTPRRWGLSDESPFERERMLDPAADTRDLHALGDAISRRFPEIAGAPILESWAGLIESSPDVLPIISASERIEGFFIATGFSGHGFGIGPGAGELVARMLTKRASSDELAPFRLGRFYDGSPIRPGPTI
ncbi:MAG TPA: FAD-binding oxidoreductase [Steroidobacteraceae bacterium]|nr:FAD-binding oxidoreductase [Steroidobacteraceae bacterium]